MATLLVGLWRCLWNQTAAEDSVHEGPCAEQIRQRREAGLAGGGTGFEWVIGARLPVAPARGNERTAAIRKHDEQQQNAAAPHSAHNRQCAALKWMPLTQYRH
jgi:hypothetical protein